MNRKNLKEAACMVGIIVLCIAMFILLQPLIRFMGIFAR